MLKQLEENTKIMNIESNELSRKISKEEENVLDTIISNDDYSDIGVSLTSLRQTPIHANILDKLSPRKEQTLPPIQTGHLKNNAGSTKPTIQSLNSPTEESQTLC